MTPRRGGCRPHSAVLPLRPAWGSSLRRKAGALAPTPEGCSDPLSSGALAAMDREGEPGAEGEVQVPRTATLPRGLATSQRTLSKCPAAVSRSGPTYRTLSQSSVEVGYRSGSRSCLPEPARLPLSQVSTSTPSCSSSCPTSCSRRRTSSYLQETALGHESQRIMANDGQAVSNLPLPQNLSAARCLAVPHSVGQPCDKSVCPPEPIDHNRKSCSTFPIE